jgi:hypothetical protein
MKTRGRPRKYASAAEYRHFRSAKARADRRRWLAAGLCGHCGITPPYIEVYEDGVKVKQYYAKLCLKDRERLSKKGGR